ncbi:hypothetical protein HanRHA438_Chr04g0150911 [Helianthus annuus]|nr:hypothetical protein HanRHA438_Chr04g0150911 [Helianthus annuus]
MFINLPTTPIQKFSLSVVQTCARIGTSTSCFSLSNSSTNSSFSFLQHSLCNTIHYKLITNNNSSNQTY